jgi:hypothetical protein
MGDRDEHAPHDDSRKRRLDLDYLVDVEVSGDRGPCEYLFYAWGLANNRF